MESQLKVKCKECEHISSIKNYAISRHVKIHNINFNDYIKKHYTLIGDIKFEKCGFCDNDAVPIFKINHNNYTYEISYENGYLCNTIECKKQISIDILGIEYDSEKYEKIGSKSEYLSKLHKISIDDSKKMKVSDNRKSFYNSIDEFIEKYGKEKGTFVYNSRIEKIKNNSDKYTKNLINTSLNGFKDRYGDEIGIVKYNERCEKIAYSNTKDYYINRFGVEEGEIRFKNKIRTKSKKSLIVGELLNNLNIKYISEKKFGTKVVDYYLSDYNIVIEYYGNYWHCNPKKYKSDYFHHYMKLSAEDIWIKDDIRLNLIMSEVNSVIIIWEDSIIDTCLLEKTINNIKNKKTIIYI